MMSIVASDFYDFELRAYNERLRAATGVGARDHVLDIGCGAGQTTRDAARAAPDGHVLGVDVSERMLGRARELTAGEGFDNVTYELGDAQVHPFASGRFDLAISRFGVMFFSEPVAAFRNIAGALRPGARLVLMIWQSRERNAWAVAIDKALGEWAAPPATQDAFSLGDRAATAQILETAGFDDVNFTDVHEPVFYGHDTTAALDWVRGFADVRNALASRDPADVARALDRLHATLAANHSTDTGIVFDARAWLITARRGPGARHQQGG